MKKIAIGIAAIAALIGTSAVASAQSTESQSTNEILHRLQVIEKETAALRERVTTLSEENAKLRDRLGEPRGSNHAAAAQQGSTTSASASKRTDANIALYDKATSPIVKAPPPAPNQVYSWSGVYIGGHIGGGWSSTTFTDPGEQEFLNVCCTSFFVGPPAGNVNLDVSNSELPKANSSSFLGGAQIGWMYQIGRLVVGGDVDWSATDLKANESAPIPLSQAFSTLVPNSGTSSFNVRTAWTATATTTVGIAADRWMYFGKAGAALAHNTYGMSLSGSVGGLPSRSALRHHHQT